LTKSFLATAIILFFGPVLIALRAQQIAPAPAPDCSYRLLRSDEDWSFLRDKNLRCDFWDPIKYISLRKTDKNWQASRHLWFQGDYGIFYPGRFLKETQPGRFLKETQPGRNLNYWALWAGYMF
jgi:hypothetical protein